MIGRLAAGHCGGVEEANGLVAALDRAPAQVEAGEARVAALVVEQFDFVWRYLRRLGVHEADVDDAAQKVFLVAARRIAEIAPGRERAFLCAAAHRVASTERRTQRRRRESGEEPSLDLPDPSRRPDELLDERRARELLDQVLDGLPFELRAVFVLFELEEMPVAEIARALELPPGTVASRLRRAREAFQGAVQRMRAREAFRGAGP